jgi:hypothetical protein
MVNTRRPRNLIVAALLVLTAALAGCATPPAPSTPAPTTIGPVFEDSDPAGTRALIESLEATPVADRDAGLFASIRPRVLLLKDADGETELPMPTDEFYVSIAPYLTQTHECFFHSLTTCLGELRDAEISLTVTDREGQVLVDETRRTQDNGFTGLWLPRDRELELAIEHDGHRAEAIIGTSVDDPTCVTTIQLH